MSNSKHLPEVQEGFICTHYHKIAFKPGEIRDIYVKMYTYNLYYYSRVALFRFYHPWQMSCKFNSRNNSHIEE